MNRLNQNKIITSVFILLFTLLAWMLGKMFLAFYVNPQSDLILPSMSTQSEKQSMNSTSMSSPIYLFGRAPANESKPLIVAKDVQKSRLSLKLLGVLIAPSASLAIIEKGGKDYSFSLGEKIQRGVVLKDVHSDYVVITHNGLLEKLEMVQDQDVFTNHDSGSELTEQQLKTLKSVKDNALKNPISIMRYVRFQMIQKDGKVSAVKVWPRAEKSIFESLGFKSGDVLKNVSGYSVEDLAKSPTLWQTLLKKTDLDLIIERNGQTQNILVQLDN